MQTPPKPDESNARPIAVLLAIAAIGGFLVSQTPLKSSRPTGDSIAIPSEDEHVEARLWEDPFEAIEDHLEAEETHHRNSNSPHLIRNLTEDIIQHSRLSLKSSEILVLLSMVDGSPYAEGNESRIQNRYAVISALATISNEPEHSDHIGYFKWDIRNNSRKQKGLLIPRCEELPSQENFGAEPRESRSNFGCDVIRKNFQDSQPFHNIVIPYEWYQRGLTRSGSHGMKVGKKWVVILWIRNQDFKDYPLQTLSLLISDIKKGTSGRLKDRLRFKVLGPRDSGTLKQMLHFSAEFQEAKKYSSRLSEKQKKELQCLENQISGLQGIEFYSPWATAADALLTPEWVRKREPKSYDLNKRLFEGLGIDFTRVLGSNVSLIESLIKELCLRGISVMEDNIALISEWDTFYGRTLPKTFASLTQDLTMSQCLVRAPEGPNIGSSSTLLERVNIIEDTKKQGNVARNLFRYAYLRGLDGQLPSAQKVPNHQKDERQKSKDNSEKIVPDLRNLERPEGKSQLDYIRRLAAKMDSDWNEESSTTNRGSLKAIGVLGSDVYDKILVLQALRELFPNTIFFTTDLDARLLHPRDYKWTRNLIIASDFGLSLNQNIQGHIPPFRQSYQTSVYLASLMALGFIEENAADKSVVLTSLLGESGEPNSEEPFTFKTGPRIFEVGRTRAVDLTNDVNEPPSIHPPNSIEIPLKTFGLTTLLILLSVILIFWIHPSWALAILIFSLTLEGAIACLWLFSNGILFPNGEPFEWFEGVSIWPTVSIRIAAALFSIIFIGKVCVDMKRKANDLWNRFNAGEHYINILLQTAVFFGVGYVLIMWLFDPPFHPCRGALSCTINKFVLITSVLLMVILIFFILEASRVCLEHCKDVWKKGKGPGGTSNGETEKDAILAIGNGTKVIGNFLYYPLVVWIFMVLSRLSIFDNWKLSIGLAIVMGIDAGLIFLAAFMQRPFAESVRREALAFLKAERFSATDPKGNTTKRSAQLDLAIEEIERTRQGAFAPLSQHPVLATVFYPFGGVGAVVFIEYLVTNLW